MPVQRQSRTDWRWRVVTDQNWRRQSQDLLTQPGYNLVPGDADFPAFFPEAYRRRHTDRGFVQSAPMSLLSLDVPFVPPVWENPKGYQRSVELLTWIQTRGPEYDDQEVKPFHQDEWPVPRGYPFPLEDRGFIGPTSRMLIAEPFNQYDWPVPRGYSFPLEDRGFLHPSFPELLLSPFNQLDWPVPKGRPYPVSLRWLGPQTLHYIYEVTGFASLSDSLAHGARLDDRWAYGGIADDALAHGARLSDANAYGGTATDDYAHGGSISDE